MDHAEKLIECLFEEILHGLRISGSLGEDEAPSFFIIYAHNDHRGGSVQDSGASLVRKLIKYFGLAGCKARSDIVPVLEMTTMPEGVYRAKSTILENQFCLLPRQIAVQPVDKIIIIASEVLINHCLDPDGRKYMDNIQQCIESGMKTEELESVTIQNTIRNLVAASEGTSSFHHVLTEVAMASSRAKLDQNPETVLPILLQGTKCKDLPLLSTTRHYLRDRQYSSMISPSSQVVHDLFLGALDDLYDRKTHITQRLVQMYRIGCRNLQPGGENRGMSLQQFQRNLSADVMEELKRAREFEPLNAKKPLARWYLQAQDDAEMPDEHPAAFVSRPKPAALFTRNQKDFLRLLAFPSMYNRISDVGPAADDTLEWVPQHPAYKRWITERSRILGIRGIPGCGKSTVLKYIAYEGRRSFTNGDGEDNLLFLAYFFNGQGSALERSRQGMYRALLVELLRRLPIAGHQVWYEMEENYEVLVRDAAVLDCTIKRLREWFLSALTIASCFYRIVIVVDALDEADDGRCNQYITAREIIADFRQINNEIGSIRSADLRICFSCRSYPAIVVDNGLEICVHESNHDGIRRYIEKELHDTFHECASPTEISSLVAGKSAGVFCFAALVMKRLNDKYRRGELHMPAKSLKQGLGDLPAQDLTEVYEQVIYRTYGASPSDQLLLLLDWIQLPQRPLTLEELRFAIASDSLYFSPHRPKRCISSHGFIPDDESMIRHAIPIFCGLSEVRYRDGKPMLTFIHQTVFDFFQEKDWRIVSSQREIPTGHARLWRSCRNFIALESDDWEGKKATQLDAIPFCRYAVENLFVHLEMALKSPWRKKFEEFAPAPSEDDKVVLRRWWDTYSTFHPGAMSWPFTWH